MLDLQPRTFPSISSRAFEHPADRAALSALRALPGFDVVVRKLLGFLGDRSLRLVFLGSAVRVSGRQFARVDALFSECCLTLDVEPRPELFVAQTPFVNAGALGVDQPFIVLNSGALKLLDDDELRTVLGHELGHVVSGHVLYKSMLALLLRLANASGLLSLGGLAASAIVGAFLEWDRKSELSADRAGLLCARDPQAALRAEMKLAGGGDVSEMSLDEFVAQADEYERSGSAVDGVLRLLNLARQRHPFPVLRVAELQKWIESAEYAAILAGRYPRRQDDPRSHVIEDLRNAARSYAESAAASKDPLLQALKGVVDDVAGASNRVWDELRKRW